VLKIYQRHWVELHEDNMRFFLSYHV